jgi:AcrR family transcriptional regulator
MPTRRRHAERSQSTRAALVAAGRTLFAERGFAATSAEEIVAAAGLTRGALAHHFGDKRGLFRAVLQQLEDEITERILRGHDDTADAWSSLQRGFAAFLDACEDPQIVQIALLDAPSVLGWANWRELEAEHGLGLIIAGLERAMADGLLPRQPINVLARLLLSAAIEASLLVAQADTTAKRSVARRDSERVLLGLIGGLRVDASQNGASAKRRSGKR